MPRIGSPLSEFIKQALMHKYYPQTLYWHDEENEIFFIYRIHANNKDKDILEEQNRIYEDWDLAKPRKRKAKESGKKQRLYVALKKQTRYFKEIEELSTKIKLAYQLVQRNSSINLTELVENLFKSDEALLEKHELNDEDMHVISCNTEDVSDENSSALLDELHLTSEYPAEPEVPNQVKSTIASQNVITYDQLKVASSCMVRVCGNKIDFIGKEEPTTSSDKCMVILN